MSENGYVKRLSELLNLSPVRKTRKIKQWHWDRNGLFKHYKSFWTRKEAMENLPTESGIYELVVGHGKYFVIVYTLKIE
jgi:hypothetical protein